MRLSCLIVLSTLILAACTSNQGVLVFRISGGETIKIPMTAKGPEHAQNKDVRVDAAACFVEHDKKELKYGFVFTELNRAPPQHVKVEDVTEREADLLLEESAPKLNDKGEWHGISAPRTGDDKSLAWLYHLDTSFRAYRFTVVTADGRTLVMYQASIIPAFVKAGLRTALDMK